MGSLLSTANSSRDPADQSWVTFPPKTGVVFAGHFYLGGEKFESVARDSFVFGESGDLHFLNSRPLPYTLPVGKPVSLSRPLQAVINVRKETVRFVKADVPHAFHVELVLDSLVDCEASVWLFAKYSFNGQRLVMEPQHPLHLSPERRRFSKGTGHVYSCTELTLRPALFDPEEGDWRSEQRDSVFSVAVLCESVEPGAAGCNQQLLLCTAERAAADATYTLKLLKQIMVIDGLPLVAHDLYGITDRGAAGALASSDLDPTEADCVVCMVKARDTVILPCRHLCLCDTCADSLRYQASCCPICRAPFRALLQLSVLQPATEGEVGEDDDSPVIVNGFREVPILEFADNVQRQSRETATGGQGAASATGAVGGEAVAIASAPPPSLTARRRPQTAQAWASPVKQPLPQQQPPQPKQSAHRQRSGKQQRRHRRRADDPDDRDADPEDNGEDDDVLDEDEPKEPDEVVVVSEHADATVAFPMAVLDRGGASRDRAGPLSVVLADGDADRASCSTSTESANSRRQLLATASAAAVAGAAVGGFGSGSSGGGGGARGATDSDAGESDFSSGPEEPARVV